MEGRVRQVEPSAYQIKMLIGGGGIEKRFNDKKEEAFCNVEGISAKFFSG